MWSEDEVGAVNQGKEDIIEAGSTSLLNVVVVYSLVMLTNFAGADQPLRTKIIRQTEDPVFTGLGPGP